MEPQARVKHLCEQANTIQLDANIPLRRYLRSGLELVKMARNHEEEKNYEDAFILYMRQITLLLETIRNHPEYSAYPQAELNSNLKNVKGSLPAAEKLKSILLKRYQHEYEQRLKQEKLREEQRMREEKDKIRKIEEEKQIVEEKMVQEFTVKTQQTEIPLDPVITEVSYPTGTLFEGEAKSIQNELNYQKVKESHPPSMPSIDRSSKPMSLMSTHRSGTKGGLRDIVVPSQMLQLFLKLAQPNTSRNIETCGILSGRVSQDQYIITHLIVPKQSGTSDSCTMLHEEELYSQQDKFDVITLGWIHTHPTMTAFLSSVDLHTHCPFQLLMPEALAIVCAPKYDEIGYFHLTPSHGLTYINNCRQQGFHPHPAEPKLFQTAQHSVVDSSRTVTVVDLRS